MPAQISPVQNTGDEIVDLRSIEISGIEQHQLRRSTPPGRVARDGIMLSLVHLDLALDVRTEGDGARKDGVSRFNVSAKRIGHGLETTGIVLAPEKSGDAVIQRLTAALAATEASPDAHSAICADALRLAILARQFSRQTNPLPTAESIACNVRSLQKWRLKRVMQYVDEHLDAKITLQDLAAATGLSRMHFAAQFRAATGMRPHEYLLKRRIQRAEELLKRVEVSLVDVALTVGFQTQAHFTTVFKRFAGDTPSQWRSAYLAQSGPMPPARAGLS